jgi:hypothetical protein
MAPLVVHLLISLMLVVRAVSSTAQWKTLRPADMALNEGRATGRFDGKIRTIKAGQRSPTLES